MLLECRWDLLAEVRAGGVSGLTPHARLSKGHVLDGPAVRSDVELCVGILGVFEREGPTHGLEGGALLYGVAADAHGGAPFVAALAAGPGSNTRAQGRRLALSMFDRPWTGKIAGSLILRVSRP